MTNNTPIRLGMVGGGQGAFIGGKRPANHTF